MSNVASTRLNLHGPGRILLAATVVLLCCAGAAWANNTVAVNGAAALQGSFGMQLSLDGSTNAAYVQDNSPNSETTYHAEFRVRRNHGGAIPDLFMDNCSGSCSTRFVQFLMRQEGPPAVTVGRLILSRLAADDGGGNPRYSLRYGVRQDDGSFRYIGGFIIPPSATLGGKLMIDWKRATGASANDGYAALYSVNLVNGNIVLIGSRNDLDNFDVDVDFVQFGAASGLNDQPSDPNTTGSIALDDFISTRTLYQP